MANTKSGLSNEETRRERRREVLHAKQREIDIAHDVRKFEIELTWKRSAYMGTFQGFLIAALGFMLAKAAPMDEWARFFSVFVCIAGLFLSRAWILINTGSKFWQRYWEQYLIEKGDKTDYESQSKSFKDKLGKYPRFSIARTNIRVSWFFFLVLGTRYHSLSKSTHDSTVQS